MSDEISKPGDRVHEYLVSYLHLDVKEVMAFFNLPRASYYRSIGNFALSKDKAVDLAKRFSVRVEFLFPEGFYTLSDFPKEDKLPKWPARKADQTFEEYCAEAPKVDYCFKHWMKISTGDMVPNRVPQALAYYHITPDAMAKAMGIKRVRRQFSPATNYGPVEALRIYAALRQLVNIRFSDIFPSGSVPEVGKPVKGYRHLCRWGYHKVLHRHDLTHCDGGIHELPTNWQSLVDAQGEYHVAVLTHLEETHPDFETIFNILSEIPNGK